tara:strand:- start:707 stop:1027 length:321 start_codon:yes stop_codon:yes gene_type:complete
MGRYLLLIICLLFINGCYQTSSSLVGPVYTLSNTGNISQAALTFGFNKIVEKNTGKTSLEYASDYLMNDTKEEILKTNKEKSTIENKELFEMVKNHLLKTKKILSN